MGKKILKFAFLFSFFVFLLTSCNSIAQDNLSPKEFDEKIRNSGVVQLIDVRTPEEFSVGHISGAINTDYYSSDIKEKFSKLDKSKPVFVYCKSGNRSGKSSKILKSMGFLVYELNGGITAWISENLQVIK